MRIWTSRIRASGLIWLVIAGCLSGTIAQQLPKDKTRIVVFQWYGRDYGANIRFEQYFQTALQPLIPGGLELYSEYLETDRFPGETQALLLRDYLRKKYSDRRIDIVVSRTSPALEFVLRHRQVLFPHASLLFSTERPVVPQRMSEMNATGIVYGNNHSKTVELALRLHPGTRNLFVVSGTLSQDRSLETIAQHELRDVPRDISITYLTDLAVTELENRVKNLPERSIVLYIWQQAQGDQGRVVETGEILELVSSASTAPVYGMSASLIGRGIIGGYVWTVEANTKSLAEMVRRIAKGIRTADIPVERAPAVPMFDSRQLQRWGVRQDRLPQDSVILFRERTLWQQYKWRIIGIVCVFVLQYALIGWLIHERRRARLAQSELRERDEHLEQLVHQRTAEAVEARDQAMAANRAKSVFLAHVSHELRTPLTAILGYSALVRADSTLADEHRKDLSVVATSGEHLLGLIDNVLDMTKIETGSTAVETTCFDLYRLATEAVNMLRERALAKNLELFLDISSSTPQYIRSDAGMLRQVLTNLLGNALKYTDKGTVAVRLDRVPGDGPEVTLIIEVQDTGMGIAEEDRVRIFDPFVQAGAASNRKGSGLGLSISRRFVELLGGTIHVEGAPRKGSRFRVEVPVQVAEAPDATAPDMSYEQVITLAPGQPDFRILVVEGRSENQTLLYRLLHNAGFHVRLAADGDEAIEIFRVWRPHFIWMDLRLPLLSGLEAAKRIRETDGGGDVKIAAVTASVLVSERDELLGAGFDDFLRKPYRPREIFDCMAHHLGARYVNAVAQTGNSTASRATLRPEDLATLPEALRQDLEEAIVSLNPPRISLVVGRIRRQNAPVGDLLGRFAESMTYTPILAALRGSESQSADRKG